MLLWKAKIGLRAGLFWLSARHPWTPPWQKAMSLSQAFDHLREEDIKADAHWL